MSMLSYQHAISVIMSRFTKKPEMVLRFAEKPEMVLRFGSKIVLKMKWDDDLLCLKIQPSRILRNMKLSWNYRRKLHQNYKD